jgi:hypothetical protein
MLCSKPNSFLLSKKETPSDGVFTTIVFELEAVSTSASVSKVEM